MSHLDLEPAVRDPKKLFKTALVLVVIMVLGGWLVLKAYEKWSIEQSKDNRPAIIHQIRPERSLTMIRQDGSTADLTELRGKVYLLNTIHLDQMDESERSLNAMRNMAEQYADNDDLRFVTLVLNPIPAESVASELSEAATKMNIELPKWWLGTNETETLKKFIRKELKPSVIPELVDGSWRFDPRVILIDKSGHIRRAVVHQEIGGKPYVATFDFNEAAGWDEEGKLTGTEHSNEKQLEILLDQTIQLLLDEPTEDE